jgi:nucleoside-triphosphatase
MASFDNLSKPIRNGKKPKILLTGIPGCGKTTVVIKLAELLKGKKIAGFYTREIRSSGRRTGFLVNTFCGAEGLLSGIKLHQGPRVGKYRVNVQAFEEIVLPELTRHPENVDVFLIDEIGKMECFSRAFIQAVNTILDGAVPVAATVALKGGGFIEEVKARKDVQMVEVASEIRNALPKKLAIELGLCDTMPTAAGGA